MKKSLKILLYIFFIFIASAIITAINMFTGIIVGGLGTIFIYGVFGILAPKAIITYVIDRKKEKDNNQQK